MLPNNAIKVDINFVGLFAINYEMFLGVSAIIKHFCLLYVFFAGGKIILQFIDYGIALQELK